MLESVDAALTPPADASFLELAARPGPCADDSGTIKTGCFAAAYITYILLNGLISMKQGARPAPGASLANGTRVTLASLTRHSYSPRPVLSRVPLCARPHRSFRTLRPARARQPTTRKRRWTSLPFRR